MATLETRNAPRLAPPHNLAQSDGFRPFRADTSPHTDAVHAGLVLLPLRIFLAAGWLSAAAEKVIDIDWWRGDTLRGFLDAQRGAQLPYFEPIAEHVIRPFAAEVAVAVVLAQILIGLALAFGRPLRIALWSGVVLNVVFIMVGRVNPSAFYLFMEAALLYGVSVGTIGHVRRRRTVRPLLTASIFLALAITQMPFITTIQPAEVIEDPAMILTFLSLVAMVTTLMRVTRNRTTSFAHRRSLTALWSLLLCRPESSMTHSSMETRATGSDPAAMAAWGHHAESAPWDPAERDANLQRR